MADSKSSKEKVKRIVLIALAGLLVFVFIYQVFLSSPAPRPRRSGQAAAGNSNTAPPARSTSAPASRPPSAAAQQEAALLARLSDLTPLNLASISRSGGNTTPSPRGNIFAYFVEPPTPPPPPPPPPPIQLSSLQPQSAVAGTPRAFALVVSGNKIPADAQILLNNGPRPTKRMSDMQLSTQISPADYAHEQSIKVQVKSQSNPAENSNELTFVVQRAPDPQFIYKGRLGPLNQPQFNYAVFELTGTREIKRAKVGDTVMGVWRIDAISADSVDVTHTQYDIKKRILLQDKVR